jgi:hypothetical protein
MEGYSWENNLFLWAIYIIAMLNNQRVYLNAVNFAEAQPGPSQDGVELWSFYSGDRGGIPGPSPGPDRTSEKKVLLNRPTKVGPWWQSTFFLPISILIIDDHYEPLLTTINIYIYTILFFGGVANIILTFNGTTHTSRPKYGDFGWVKTLGSETENP